MQCTQPRLLKGKGIKVPCLICMPCRINDAENWRFRLMQEMERASSASFITLTYSDDYIVRNDSGHPILIKSDLQKFFKRLRYFTSEYENDYKTKNLSYHQTATFKPIKYYAVGEYGGETYRPHYHTIAFNIPKGVISQLPKIWKFGFVRIDPVNRSTIGYVTKYITKVDSRDIERMDLTKPFRLISKGVGEAYVNDDNRKYHQQSDSLYTINRGHRQKIGKYLENKIHTDDYWKERVSEEKRSFAEQKKEEYIQKLKRGETSYTDQKRKQEAFETKVNLNNKRKKL